MLDLSEGILREFAEYQSLVDQSVAENIAWATARAGRTEAQRTYRAARPHARLAHAAASKSAGRAEIRRRILAGERPARMRAAWYEVARELGIDLSRPQGSTPEERARRAAAKRARQEADIRRRLLAGERPAKRAWPPVAWIRVAESLGIDLTGGEQS